jgi:hypothetical protein
VTVFGKVINEEKLEENERLEIVEKDLEEEKQKSEFNPELSDSVISNFRIWTDYDNNTYSANLMMKLENYQSSAVFRNQLQFKVYDNSTYNQIVNELYLNDKRKMDLIFSMFDSLKTHNNLDEFEFAEVIVSCIQDIPYTLILDEACDDRLYNDQFIVDYIRSGNKCEGNVTFGLFSPVEFVTNLSGDCDTRSLLLFTILDHYGYDVTMLISQLYKHSIIGINLKYNGVSKTINNKRYVLWETTARGYKPGVIPKEYRNPVFWDVALISKK